MAQLRLGLGHALVDVVAHDRVVVVDLALGRRVAGVLVEQAHLVADLVGVDVLGRSHVPVLPVVVAPARVEVDGEVLARVDELDLGPQQPVAVGADRAVLVEDELRVPQQAEARADADPGLRHVVVADAGAGVELDLDRQPAGRRRGVLVEVDVELGGPGRVVGAVGLLADVLLTVVVSRAIAAPWAIICATARLPAVRCRASTWPDCVSGIVAGRGDGGRRRPPRPPRPAPSRRVPVGQRAVGELLGQRLPALSRRSSRASSKRSACHSRASRAGRRRSAARGGRGRHPGRGPAGRATAPGGRAPPARRRAPRLAPRAPVQRARRPERSCTTRRAGALDGERRPRRCGSARARPPPPARSRVLERSRLGRHRPTLSDLDM